MNDFFWPGNRCKEYERAAYIVANLVVVDVVLLRDLELHHTHHHLALFGWEPQIHALRQKSGVKISKSLPSAALRVSARRAARLARSFSMLYIISPFRCRFGFGFSSLTGCKRCNARATLNAQQSQGRQMPFCASRVLSAVVMYASLRIASSVIFRPGLLFLVELYPCSKANSGIEARVLDCRHKLRFGVQQILFGGVVHDDLLVGGVYWACRLFGDC